MGMTIADRSILQTFVINFVLALIAWIVFCFIRPKFPKAYKARATENLETPNSGDGFFDWVIPTLTYPDDKIIQNHGIDTAMYIRYIRTFVFAFLGFFVLAYLIIVPINATGSNRNQPRNLTTCINDTTGERTLWGDCGINPLFVEGIPVMSVSNINPNRDYPGHGWLAENTRLTAHLVMTWVFTAILCFLLYRDWEAFARYRVTDRAFKNHVQNYSVLVMDCPVDLTDSCAEAEKKVTTYFNRMFPGKVRAVQVVWNAPKIRAAIVLYNEAVIKYEKAEAAHNAKGERPTHKLGFLGLIGDKVDSLDHWKEQKAKLFAKITKAQNTRSKYELTKAAIVTFTDQHSAAAAAATSLSHTSAQWASLRAPEPRDVYWPNLGVAEIARMIRTFVVKIFIFLLVFFWSIPVLFAASLANIEKISRNKGLGWLRDVVYANEQVGTFIAGFLPVLVVILFFVLLLLIIRTIAKQKKSYSGTLVDKAVRNYYFAFQFVNILLVYTLSGSFFLNSKQFLNSVNFSSIVNLIAISVPPQAQFFSNYVMTAAMLGQALGVLRPAVPIVHAIMEKFLVKTARDRKNLYATPCWEFAPPYSTTSLIFCITLIYSLMNPFILIWGVLYFCSHYVAVRYNLLHTFRSHYDSAGDLWPTAFYHITVGIVFFQIVMFGLLLAFQYIAAVAILPLVPLTILFYGFVLRRFERPVAWGALDTLSVDHTDEQHAHAAAEAGDGKGMEAISLKEKERDALPVGFDVAYLQPERQPLVQDEVVNLGLL